MKRRTLLLLAATASCQGSAVERWRLARALASVARSAGEATDADETWLLAELDRIAQTGRRLRKHPDASTTVIRVLFEELDFAREVDSTDLRFVLLPSVLRERRGSCVGLGTLYLVLAEGLGIEARGAIRPGHFYARHVGQDGPRNVELLRRGETMPNHWYHNRFPAPKGTAGYYSTLLSNEQVLGVVEFNIGNERRRQHRYIEAEAAYARAVRRFPDFAEAHASLGAMQHLLGKLASAAMSYTTARKLNSSLAGLDANVAMLNAEMAGSD